MKYLISILIITIMWSCSDESSTNDLPGEYCYEVTLNCFCVHRGPHYLHIKDGAIIAYNPPNDQMELDQALIESLRIQALSERVETYLESEVFSQQIEYHPIYGFPSRVFIDVDSGIADEEWGYEITNFEVK